MENISQATCGIATVVDLEEEQDITIRPDQRHNQIRVELQALSEGQNPREVFERLLQTWNLEDNGGKTLQSYLKETNVDLQCLLDESGYRKLDPDIRIRSVSEELSESVTLEPGIHFVSLQEGNVRVDLPKNNRAPLIEGEARMKIGTPEGATATIEACTGDARMNMISVLQPPATETLDAQYTVPEGKQYLKEGFSAHPLFQTNINNEPSWYQLSMDPLSDQRGHEHVHPNDRLVLVVEGSGKLFTGTKRSCTEAPIALRPNMVVHLPAGTWHYFTAGEKGLVVRPVHPVTPGVGAGDNNHPMFEGTIADLGEVQRHLEKTEVSRL